MTVGRAGSRTIFLGSVLWSLALYAGHREVLRYSSTPGRAGPPPVRWPAESRLRPEPGRFRVVMAVHPRCPCTRASLAELARIVARGRGLASYHVIFFRPDRGDDDWTNTPNHRAASSIPGVQVVDDPGGAEAGRFGALTSGHVVVYDRLGLLRFSGGVTRARGHEGDNPGRQAVTELLASGAPGAVETPVFGCPILPATGRNDDGL